MNKKLISFITAVSLAFSSLPAPVFGSTGKAFSVESINSSVAVTAASYKDSRVTVFNIQDLHFNPEAQKKIFFLLEKINEAYPGFELYVEGASVNSDFEWVYSSLGKKSGDVFVDALFNSGNLSGAEYFAAKHNKKISPVEDSQIYDKNLLLFADLIESRAETANLLQSLEERFSGLRNKYLTSDQRKLFSVYQKYRGGSVSDSDYFDYLRKESLRNGIDINDYPNLSLYMLTSGSVMSVSQKRLQSQMSELFTNLKNNLNYKQYSELLSASNNFKDRQALISYLYQNKDNVNLEKYPELNKFIISIALSDKLNRLEFIMEEGYLLSDLSSKLSTDVNSRNIIFISQFMNTYRNVLTASAAADEYRYYKDNLPKFKNLVSQYTSANALAKLSSFETKAEEFSDINLHRNEIFVAKMFGGITRREGITPDLYFGVAANAKAVFENAAKSKIKVIVAGGFHTDGINSILNEKRVNNVTFMPKINTAGKDYSFKYVEYAKLLSNAENSAIPRKSINEMSPRAFADTVLRTVAAGSFDLSSDEVQREIEKFVAAGKGDISNEDGTRQKAQMSEIKFSYDKRSNELSLVYKNEERGEIDVVKVNAEEISQSGADDAFTTLGNFTAKTVQKIIMSPVEDLTNSIYLQVLKMILATGEYETDEQEDALRNSLITGTFDLEKFFLGNPLQLQNLVLGLFKSNVIIDTSKYNVMIDKLKAAAVSSLEQTDVSIVVSDAPMLISDDGWCFASYNRVSRRSGVLYVNTVFMDKLLKVAEESSGEQIVDGIINALMQHESFETSALYDEKSPIYASFGEYLRSKDLTEESRIPFYFHEYMKDKSSPYFTTFLSQTGRQNIVNQQRYLLSFAEETYIQHLGEHEETVTLEKIDSFQDMDPSLKEDLLRMRIGDNEILEKYGERLKAEIEKQIEASGLPKSEFVIAFRETFPQHIIQPVAESIAKELGVKKSYISQSAYMDKSVFLDEKPEVDLKGKFEIAPRRDDVSRDKDLSVVGKEGIPGKHIILIEDTQKTGSLFAAYARLFNVENAATVSPITIFDIKDAKLSKDGVRRVDSRFNLDDYLKEYIADNPEKVARIIIDMEGKSSKYVYNALMLLIKENRYEPFSKLAKTFNEGSEIANRSKENFIQAVIDVQTKYPQLAISLIPLIYAIYTANPNSKNLSLEIPVICAEMKKKFKTSGDKGVFNLEKDEYKKWDQPWLIALYAYLNGYTKIKVNFSHIEGDDKGEGVTKSQMELLRDACKALNVSCLTRNFKSDVDLSGLTEADQKKLEEMIKSKNLPEAVASAKADFDKAVKLGNIKAEEENYAENYKERIKAIMNEVDALVVEFLHSEGYKVNPSDYSIVIGGSLVKGSVTSESDIYYDVVFSDRQIMLNLKKVLLPSYHYALSCTGITPYLLNGYNLNYLGEDGISSTFAQINMGNSDERGVAAVFDFEQIKPGVGTQLTVFEQYIKSINKISVKKKLSSLIPGIREASKVYRDILKTGNYSVTGDTNMLTFFNNYYAASFNEKEETQYDYRWTLRALETLLKEVLIQNLINNTNIEIELLPKETDKLIMYMFDRSYFPRSFVKRGDADTLIQAWKTISYAMQKKVADGDSYKWTTMTAAERSALKTISAFSNNIAKAYVVKGTVDIKPEDTILQAADSFIHARVDGKKYDQIIEKVERYDSCAAQEGAFSTDTALALMFSELDDGENAFNLFIEESGYASAQAVLDVIGKIKTVRDMPQYKNLAGDFTVLNYMNEIIDIAGNSDHMTAIFIDKLHELINAEKAASYDLKATFFTIYIPLARRLNANFIFEEMRNAVFAETQKKKFNKTKSDTEQQTGMPYAALQGVLDLLKKELLEELTKKTGAFDEEAIHTRVKTLYSVFEKIESSRKSSDGAADILGLHVVVGSAERDKILDYIKEFFKGSASFSIVKEGFDPLMAKGFARKKIAFKYGDKKIGELVLYTEEEYKKEHFGLITDFASKYPLPHWIYKIGEDITYQDQKYSDGIFEMKVSIKHLFEGEDYKGTDYDKENSFFFMSDDVVLDGNFADNFKAVSDKISSEKRITIIKDGMTHILSIPADANGYDLLASARLQDEDKNITLVDENGVIASDLYESLRPGAKFSLVEGESSLWSGVSAESVSILRAKMFAKLGTDDPHAIGAMPKPAELSEVEDDIINIYAHTMGLKDAAELYYVLSDSSISDGFVSVEEILEFSKDKGKIMYQFKLSDYADSFPDDFENWMGYARQFLLDELGGEKSDVNLITAESDYDSLSVVMIFSGDKSKIDAAVKKFVASEKRLKIEYFTSSKDKEIKEVNNPVYLKLRALGSRIRDLIAAAQEYPVLAANALYHLFESGIVEGMFLDDSRLILKQEAESVLDIIKSSLAANDAKYRGYDYEFVVSDNKDLIFSKDIYAMASMKVADPVIGHYGEPGERGKVILYVNEVFLRAMGSNDAERAFYLQQLAHHEAGEFLKETLLGSGFDYERYHKLLRETNPAQAKLMEFASRAVIEEMERRSNEQLVNEVTADFPGIESGKDIASAASEELVRNIIDMDNTGMADASVWIKVTALLEISEDKASIRKALLDIISNVKDADGNSVYPIKESVIDAVAAKIPQDSYQFETVKTFLDFVYYDIEKTAKYKKIVKRVLRDAQVFSKTPLVIQEAAVKRARAPEYLKSKERAFIFDVENAASKADLISYMGSYASKSFSVSRRLYINPSDVLFTFKVNTGVRNIDVKVALKRVETKQGTYFELQYSMPFIYEVFTEEERQIKAGTKADEIIKEAKEELLNSVFENPELMSKLKKEGLNLSKSTEKLFVENLPVDGSLMTMQDLSGRIAESAGLKAEINKVESKTVKKGVYNEKLPVAAMLRNKNEDTGIGEITFLRKYAEDVLKSASVNGFTMYDLFAADNPLAANYMLLDWMAVPEAQGAVTRQDLMVTDYETDAVNKELVVKRKTLAAVKVYQKLTVEQRAEVDTYYKENSSWLDPFTAEEMQKYGIDIDQSAFVKIMAMQQMFFERQLKETVMQMTDMNVSMYIKDINANNARAVISKWVSAGITSFTVEMDTVDETVLDSIAAAAAEAGFFINVAVKSANMDTRSAKTISDFGYTPVVLFQDLGKYGNVSGYKTEINGETFVKTALNMDDLLRNSALSGAESVDYPIGLLWGEIVDDSVENYRVPEKGSTRFGGFKFGLFTVGQKTFEESYAGSYLNSVETGLNIDTSSVSFDVKTTGMIDINGKPLPAAYAAVLLGSLAKQNRLSEVNDFEGVVDALTDRLDPKGSLKAVRLRLVGMLADYRSSEGKKKEINAAKIAGFLQGLNENIIISSVNGKFTSNAIAKVYANLMSEMTLFLSGYYPSSQMSEELVVSEKLLEKVEDILDKNTFAKAVAEIEPLLLNLSVPIQKSGFSYEMYRESEVAENKEKSERALTMYTVLTGHMLDIFIDKVATREQIKRSAQTSSIAAVRTILASA